MRKNYYVFLTLFSFFCVQLVSAQFCPPYGFTNGNSLFFSYESGTSACVDRPTVVYVGSSEFTRVACDDLSSVYNLTSGSPVSTINTFEVDFGFDTCGYTNGNLPVEGFSLSAESVKLYPNPINSGNYLYVDFGFSKITADIKIYSVTGKMVQNYALKNSSKASVNISGLTNGVYLLKITSNSQTATRKFVIMK